VRNLALENASWLTRRDETGGFGVRGSATAMNNSWPAFPHTARTWLFSERGRTQESIDNDLLVSSSSSSSVLHPRTPANPSLSLARSIVIFRTFPLSLSISSCCSPCVSHILSCIAAVTERHGSS